MAKAPCGTWKVTDVPEDRVGEVTAEANLDGAKSVTSEKQPDGMYTVTAVYEDCPAGEPNAAEKSFSKP
jgi:hypothetical protein